LAPSETPEIELAVASLSAGFTVPHDRRRPVDAAGGVVLLGRIALLSDKGEDLEMGE
jgi:hypothetical protein